MARLMDDLMDLSRMDLGRIGLPEGSGRPGGRRRRVIETSRPAARAAEAGADRGPARRADRLEADPTRLEQVPSNLLSNAAKYTEPGGQIRLRSRREGGEASLRVRDTGIGIAAGDAAEGLRDVRPGRTSRSDRTQGGLGIGLTPGEEPGRDARGTIDGPQRRAGPGQRVRGAAARLPDEATGAGRARTGEAGGTESRRPRPAAASWWWTTTWTRPRAWPGCWGGCTGRRCGSPTTAPRPWRSPAEFRPEVDPAGHRPAGDGRLRGGPAAAGAAGVDRKC